MKIGIIGFGNMGSAIYKALLNNPSFKGEFFIYDAQKSQLEKHNIKSTPLNTPLTLDYIILAVKPKDIQNLTPLSWQGPLISIAAGVSIKELQKTFPNRLLVRLMPNTPLLVKQGISGVFFDSLWQEKEKSQCLSFLEHFTQIVLLEKEELISAVTALSGSGPAFVYLFIEALCDAGVRAGLNKEQALKLASQTVLGSAQMVISQNMHPCQLKDQVTSPAGTTIEGIAALDKNGFKHAVGQGVWAAFLKAQNTL